MIVEAIVTKPGTLTQVIYHTPSGPLVYWLRPGEYVDLILRTRS